MTLTSRPVAWTINLVIPLLINFFGPSIGLTPVMATFFALTVWAIIGWILETLPDKLIAILLPAFYVIFHVGTGKQIFGAWGSSIPWLIIGGMMMGMIMMQTGLAKRIAIMSIRISGLSFIRVMLGLMLAGLIISPFVPSVMGKSAIVSVICIGICQALNLKPGTREGSTVFIIGFLSVACPKLAYLTGGGDIVVAMRFAGEVAGAPVSWMQYFIHNFPLAIIYALISFVMVMLIMRPETGEGLEEFINEEFKALGPVKASEKKSILIMVIMLILMATEKVHGVPAGYCLLLMGAACFLPGVDLLNQENLGKLNFGVIFFVVGCMCIGAGAKVSGVDTWFSELVKPMLNGSQIFTIIGIFLVGLLCNFFLTPLAALSTLSTPIAQIATDMGLNPIVAAYSLIYGVDQYIFPYEYAVLLYFYSSGYMRIKDVFITMGLRAILTIIFLLVIALPYWKLIGLM